LHNLAYTTFEALTYLSAGPRKSFTYGNQRSRSIPFPKPLIVQAQTSSNVDFIQRQGVTLKVTNLERTLVDILDRPDLGGGWEEIWRSLDHLIHFDPTKLIKYTLLLNNATTVSKVGFFLEQRPAHLKID
jgi:predicted transcriptional regulator of viral defense system